MLEPGQDFSTQGIDERLCDDLTELVRLAIREDLDRSFDLTTIAVVPQELQAEAAIVSRAAGIAAGIDLIPTMLIAMDDKLHVESNVQDGESYEAQQCLATLSGAARDLLTCERTILNFLGRLCGIATWTNQHVAEIQDSKANLYDTRKTTPGWRRLEKYATRCGGAKNHRSGLYEAVMIKDNHLACHASASGKQMSPSEAVRYVQEYLKNAEGVDSSSIVEIEVDTLEQLRDALTASPDIVLLDNMNCATMVEAVAIRDSANPAVQLEASGGITLDTLRDKAATGVDRISLGALTHSATNIDLGLDWKIG